MMSSCCVTLRNCGNSIRPAVTADAGQHRQVADPAPNRVPQRLEEPPGADQHHDDDAAGDVHREDTDKGQYGHRDAVAVLQRRGDQGHGRDGDPVGRQVGHRGGVEFDVGHRGERRR